MTVDPKPIRGASEEKTEQRPGGPLVGVSRRSFLRGTAAGVVWSVVSPGVAPWAYGGVSGLVGQYDAAVANAHARMLLRLVKSTPGFTPPVAARVFGYFGVALYESLVPGMPRNRSLHALIPGFPRSPQHPRSSMHWPTVANHALGKLIAALFPSDAPLLGDLWGLIDRIDGQLGVPGPIRRRSVARGETVASIVAEWAATDGGHDGFRMNFPSDHVYPTGSGLWEPTPPGFQPVPLQPFWGENRPLVSSSCEAPPPPEHSVHPSSQFYAYALEVYETSLTLTMEQIEIALFWADDPGTVTPPGHSFSILEQILTAEDVSLERAAEAYLRVGCALTDAFIQCWRTKYSWNLVRPVTYIRVNFDPLWSSLVTTPPFPEYTSGHSTQSGAWAEVMTSLFGDGYGFTDHTHDEAGISARQFSSFHQAAQETAVSRLYGGIHYRFGNDNGLASGSCVGREAAALPIRR